MMDLNFCYIAFTLKIKLRHALATVQLFNLSKTEFLSFISSRSA